MYYTTVIPSDWAMEYYYRMTEYALFCDCFLADQELSCSGARGIDVDDSCEQHMHHVALSYLNIRFAYELYRQLNPGMDYLYYQQFIDENLVHWPKDYQPPVTAFFADTDDLYQRLYLQMQGVYWKAFREWGQFETSLTYLPRADHHYHSVVCLKRGEADPTWASTETAVTPIDFTQTQSVQLALTL